MVADRKPLSRAKPGINGERRYFHPHGYIIRREVRDWNAYGVLGGQGGTVIDPKVSWVVHRAFTSPSKWLESFRTLREARAWCDEHPHEADPDASRKESTDA